MCPCDFQSRCSWDVAYKPPSRVQTSRPAAPPPPELPPGLQTLFLGPDPEAVWLTGHLGTDLCVISPTSVFTRDVGPWGCRRGGRVAVGTGRPAPEPRPSGPCLRPVSASRVSPPFLGRISPQALPVLSFCPHVPVAALPQGLGHCHHLSVFHSASMFGEPAPWPASRVQTGSQRRTVLGPRLCFSLRRHVTKDASLSVRPVRLTVEYGSRERPPPHQAGACARGTWRSPPTTDLCPPGYFCLPLGLTSAGPPALCECGPAPVVASVRWSPTWTPPTPPSFCSGWVTVARAHGGGIAGHGAVGASGKPPPSRRFVVPAPGPGALASTC